MRFRKSLKYAFRGIIYCINTEKNMRFHTVAILYVLLLAPYFSLSRAEWAILFLTFAVVTAAECFNTVAERLSDFSASNFNTVVRVVKDMAAGAVLLCALFSIAVAVCLFWKPEGFWNLWQTFFKNPTFPVLLILLAFPSYFYVSWGPLEIRDRIHHRRIVGLRVHQKKYSSEKSENNKNNLV